jgi:hypothetical protein
MKLHSTIFGIPLLSTLLLLGCTDQKARDDIQALQKGTLEFASNQDSANKGFVSGHNEQTTAIKDLQERVKALQVQSSILLDAEKQPNIDIHGRGYTAVKTASGFVFLALVEHVEAKLDGVSVKLQVGNPYNMQVNDLNVTLRWNQTYPAFITDLKANAGDMSKFLESYLAFEKSMKSATQHFVTPVMPGSWTSVEMILSPATIADIKYCSISIELGNTVLVQPKQ